MAIALVGTKGAASQGASGAAVTPAWGTGESRTANNLLVCWVTVTGSATIASQPSGWSTAITRAGTSCSVAIFHKKAAGSDTAPTISAITGGVIAAQLAEFSGADPNTIDWSGSAAGTTTPQVSTNGGTDKTTGELMLTSYAIFYNRNSRPTLTDTYTNGTAIVTNNAASNVPNHYDFAYSLTTANTLADSDSFAYTTANITGCAGSICSFRVATIGTKTQTATARVQKTGLTKDQSATARISKTGNTKTQSATALIQKTGLTKDQSATARILKTGLTKDQSATARILKTGNTKDQSATARIQKTGNIKTQIATARLTVPGLINLQPAIASIQKSGLTKTQSATALIQTTGNIKTQPATARISLVSTFAQLATATIILPGGIKVWKGGQWVKKPVKVYIGGVWVTKPVKVWDGGSWVTKG